MNWIKLFKAIGIVLAVFGILILSAIEPIALFVLIGILILIGAIGTVYDNLD